MPRQPQIPPAYTKRVFTVAEGRAAGISRGVIAGPRFWTPLHGVRAPRELPDDLDTRLAAAALIVEAPFAFSRETAAAIRRLPLPMELQDSLDVHVTVPPGRDLPDRRGPQGHRVVGHSGLVLDELRLVRGWPLTSAPTLFLDLATVLALDHLVALGDAMLRSGTSEADIHAVLEAASGRRGAARARAAAGLLRHRVDSPMETLTRLLLVRAGLPEPETGVVVHGPFGWIGAVDLAYRAQRIAIEYDGEQHRNVRQFRNDVSKSQLLQDAGWLVFRITARDLQNPARFLDRVREALATRSVNGAR